MKASILINGSPTKEYNFDRGIRHGDPMSQLLFNLVGEVFNLMTEKAKVLGLIKGIKFQYDSTEISHIQFVDDTIIFLQQDEASLLNCKRLLQCFQLTSGLKINFSKSALYARGVDDEVLHSWTYLLGFLQVNFLLLIQEPLQEQIQNTSTFGIH